jgi:hypothetical protein
MAVRGGAYRCRRMCEPRKHHFVPQLYQRAFARQRRKQHQALVLDRATGDGGLRNVRDIFAQRDWNTIVDAEGNRNFEVEKLLADYVESAAQPALQAMRSGTFPLSEEDRDALALFMSAQLGRGRVIRANLTESLSEVMRMALSIAGDKYSDAQWLAATGEVPSPEVRKRIINNREHINVRPTNAVLLDTLLGAVADVAGVLDQRTWTLACFEQPCLFTAENPVVHINPTGEQYGYGVATAERLYMPVSPSHALLLSHPWTSWPEASVQGTTELAVRLNWAMLSYPSNRELLLHPDIEHHPLPGAALLAGGNPWPWGQDPESAPPVFMHYLSRPPRGDLGRPLGGLLGRALGQV